MNRLEGKYVLITGASQGLGRQLAISYAREGAAGIIAHERGARRALDRRNRRVFGWRRARGERARRHDRCHYEDAYSCEQRGERSPTGH